MTLDLRSLVPERDVLRDYGHYVQTRCPFPERHAHGDRNPSCLVYPDGFHCRGCGITGGLDKWVQALYHLSPEDAAEKLLTGEGLEIRKVSASSVKPRPVFRFDEARLWAWHYAITPEIMARYRERGIDEASVVRYRLGYGRRYPEDHPRLVLPRLWQGKVMGVKFRKLVPDDGQAKYYQWPGKSDSGLWTPDQGSRLLRALESPVRGSQGLSEAFPQEVWITEGEFDAMILNRVGVYAVSPWYGAQGVSRDWTDRLLGVSRLYVLLDNDQPDKGVNPGLLFGEKIRRHLPQARLLLPPSGIKDATEWFLNGLELNDLRRIQKQADFQAIRRRLQDTILG